ncbi:MAG TPA: Rieske 2Fe-2S domain-containing protein [Mucilaginibacter sp.]|jgi:nitrite reductase/ring-hydroxylating ferredoxin subunit|nr:Rieske 2Fe-2S domain-containing protein [Mucilaginibacter sp.]
MKWYKIPGIEHTDQPFIKKIKAGNKSICLVGYEGEIFALSVRCPHAGGDLSLGWCNNGKLVCPIHRYSFDLQSGKGSEGQNDYINTYPVKIEGQFIYIGILSFWDRLKQALNT